MRPRLNLKFTEICHITKLLRKDQKESTEDHSNTKDINEDILKKVSDFLLADEYYDKG